MTYAELIAIELSPYPLGSSKVLLTPPVIFSCGGPIDLRNPVPASVRGWFHQHCATHEPDLYYSLVLAEGFKDYLQHYPNLHEFENAIADVASLILIFVESPGSIAELGIFVSSKAARKKLTAIVESDKVRGEDSFIFLGPIATLKSDDSSSVLVYPFPNPEDKAYDQLNSITSDIKERLRSAHDAETFADESFAHFFFLVQEIARLAWPIREGEIRSVLERLGVSPTDRLRRSLYLLKGLGFLDKEPYSDSDWYHPTSNVIRMRFAASKSGEIFDESSLRIALRSFSTSSSENIEQKRVGVLRQIRKRAV